MVNSDSYKAFSSGQLTIWWAHVNWGLFCLVKLYMNSIIFMRSLNEIFRNEIKIPPGYRVLEMSFETSNEFLIYILSMGDFKWGRGEVVGICTGTHPPPHMSFINGGDESRTSRRTPELQHPYALTSSWYWVWQSCMLP